MQTKKKSKTNKKKLTKQKEKNFLGKRRASSQSYTE